MSEIAGDGQTQAQSGGGMPLWLRPIIGSNPKRTLFRLVFWIVGSVIVFKFLFLPMWVEGVSMEPTYADGGFNFVNTLAYRSKAPERSDVIAIRIAKSKLMLMKRVIGMPGEKVEMKDGTLLINGNEFEEPYVKLKTDPPWKISPVQLGKDEYFVVGDNRGMKMEQHVHGKIHRTNIVGRIAF